jgi:hypothetical protein
MPITVDIAVMLAKRKMSVGELAERVGITPANLAVAMEQPRSRVLGAKLFWHVGSERRTPVVVARQSRKAPLSAVDGDAVRSTPGAGSRLNRLADSRLVTSA